MLIKNVKVFTEDKKFKNGAIVLEGDKIKAVYTEANMPDSDLEETIDGNGAYAIPGLIDLHFHGCKGDDFCDGTKEAIARIAEYEACNYDTSGGRTGAYFRGGCRIQKRKYRQAQS